MNKGFALIELIVVVAIISALSGIVLFSIVKYINSGKDSNAAGNLSVLVPAGEIYYNNNGNSYGGFCDSEIVRNAYSQMPKNLDGSCYEELNNPAGVCCSVNTDGDKWAVCARKFANPEKAFCVDSRGVKKEIGANSCGTATTVCK